MIITTTIHPTLTYILELYQTILPKYQVMQSKLIKTMHNTAKADKYFRLVSNSVKFLRASCDQSKTKYSKIYKQLLIVRQIIRWNNIYNVCKQIHEAGLNNLKFAQISTFLFSLLEIFGDMLDRFIFVLSLLDMKQYQGRLSKIQQMQSDCYFIECTIWLFYHLRTFMQIWRKGDQQMRKNKILKILKYILDCLTSYTKFSKRVWELDQRNSAILGIISSIIGMYDILK